jgi:hypothetical protein
MHQSSGERAIEEGYKVLGIASWGGLLNYNPNDEEGGKNTLYL